MNLTQQEIADACAHDGVELVSVGSGELHGPCPLCGGTDRFHVRADGVFDCRQCGNCTGSTEFYGDVLRKLGLATDPKGKGAADRVLRFEIKDVAGTVLAVRYRREKANGEKKLWWATPMPGDREVNRLFGMRTYDLPCYGTEGLGAAGAAAEVVIVEGEKTADVFRFALTDRDRPLVVLGTVTGASGTPTPTALEPIAPVVQPGGSPERTIYLWPDNDDSGRKHMQRVGSALVKAGVKAGNIRVIDWSDAPAKGDAADWAATGCKPSWLDLSRAAKQYEPPRPGRPAKAKNARPDWAQGLPEVHIIPGTALHWNRQAVQILADAGPKDDRQSLYASPVTATATGETTGGVTLLRTQPKAAGSDASQWSAQTDRAVGANVRWPPGELVIEGATNQAVRALLRRHAWWLKGPQPGSLKPFDPTVDHAGAVLEQYRLDSHHQEFPRFRLLRGIVDAPTLRHDGTVIDKPGYDDQSGLFAAFDGVWPEIPSEPTRDDARKALRELEEVVAESPFASDEHKAVWVAAVLTLIGRELCGNVPLFAVSANNRGAGKGTLVDMATAIATGRPAAKWSPPSGGRASDQDAEADKRLTTVALNGTRALVIDNVRGGEPFGTPSLDRALTTGTDTTIGEVSGRVLSRNVEARAPWRVVTFCTGNNLEMRGDLDRRAVLCRLHTDEMRPELREFQRRNPIEHCLSHRKRLLVAALIVLLSHHRELDNGTVQPLPTWNSFGAWSDHIRSAIVWAGGADPLKTAEEVVAQSHSEQQEAEAFLAAWFQTFQSREVRTSEIDDACREGRSTYSQELAAAVADLDIAPPRGQAAVNTRSLGTWLTANKNRPRHRYVLRKGERRSRSWYVELVQQTVTIQELARAIDSRLEAGEIPKVHYEANANDDSRTVVLSDPPMRADGVPTDVWSLLFHCLMSGWPPEDLEVYWELWRTRERIVAALREVADTDEDNRKADGLAQLPLEYLYSAVAETRRFRAPTKEGCVVKGCFEDPLTSAGYCIVHMPDDHRIGRTTVGDLRKAGIWWPYKFGPLARLLWPKLAAGNLARSDDTPPDTETGDTGQSVPRCVGCSTTEGRIVLRALRAGLTPRYGLACEACAESPMGQGGEA